MAIDNSETTTLAGGCFWCVEAVFLRVEGIRKVTSGYTGGSLNNPTYEEVCSESTGHAEAVQVEFYPKIISFEEILDIFLPYMTQPLLTIKAMILEQGTALPFLPTRNRNT